MHCVAAEPVFYPCRNYCEGKMLARGEEILEEFLIHFVIREIT